MADDELPLFNLGDLGVNIVRSPLHMDDGMLQLAQNADTSYAHARRGLVKRPGMAAFTDDLGAGLLALANITLIPAPEAPPDPVTGEPQTLDDFGPAAINTMRAKAYLSAATTSVPNATETTVSFDTEVYDVGNLHDVLTNPSRFTVPTGGDGLYLVIGQIAWAADADGIRSTRLYKNGTSLEGQQDVAAGTVALSRTQVLAVVSLLAAEYVEMKAYHTAGGALDLQGSSEDETYLTLFRLLSTVTTTLPRCQAQRTANQTISNGAATAVALNGETFDTHAMHDNSSNNSRITIPANQAGLYAIIGQFAWASALIGPFQVSIQLSGGGFLARTRYIGANDTTQDATGQVVCTAVLAAGDYVEMIVQQNKVGGGSHDLLGGTLAQTTLQVARIG